MYQCCDEGNIGTSYGQLGLNEGSRGGCTYMAATAPKKDNTKNTMKSFRQSNLFLARCSGSLVLKSRDPSARSLSTLFHGLGPPPRYHFGVVLAEGASSSDPKTIES